MNKATLKNVLNIILAISCAGLVAGCPLESRVCDPGETQSCYCPGGEGAQTCYADGSAWGVCSCGSQNTCGDGSCDPSESCSTCAADCGACPSACGPDNFVVDCGNGYTCPSHGTCAPQGCTCESGFVAKDCSGSPCSNGGCFPPNWWCAQGTSSGCGDGVCAPGESCPQDCGVVLPVPSIPQLTQVWCWAATTEMILQYFGKPGTQCEIASYWTGAPCCPFGNGVQACYVGAPNAEAIALAIEVGGVNAQVVYNPLSFQQVAAELAQNHPILILYLDSFAGHVVVLHGFDAAGNVYIHDPMYGNFVVPYAVSQLYQGAATWSQSIITGL